MLVGCLRIGIVRLSPTLALTVCRTEPDRRSRSIYLERLAEGISLPVHRTWTRRRDESSGIFRQSDTEMVHRQMWVPSQPECDRFALIDLCSYAIAVKDVGSFRYFIPRDASHRIEISPTGVRLIVCTYHAGQAPYQNSTDPQ